MKIKQAQELEALKKKQKNMQSESIVSGSDVEEISNHNENLSNKTPTTSNLGSPKEKKQKKPAATQSGIPW